MLDLKQSIAFINRKGGVGKTSSIYNVAGILAEQRQEKVLIIDMDAQCNTTLTCLANTIEDELPSKNVLDVLNGEDILKALGKVYWTKTGHRNSSYANVDVIAGSPIIDTIKGLYAISQEERELIGRKINYFINSNGYTWVLVDMPPSNADINDFCFKYLANNAIIPFSADMYSLSGYNLIMNDIDKARTHNESLKVIGIYLTRKDRFDIHNQIEQAISSFDSFITTIPNHSAVAISTAIARPMCISAKKDVAEIAYEKIVESMYEKM